MAVGDPVTQAQFFDRMQLFDDKLQEMHRRQREHVDRRFAELEAVFSRHEDDDQAVEKRVTVIETERGIEKQQAARQGAIYGMAAAAGVNIIIAAFKRIVGWS